MVLDREGRTCLVRLRVAPERSKGGELEKPCWIYWLLDTSVKGYRGILAFLVGGLVLGLDTWKANQDGRLSECAENALCNVQLNDSMLIESKAANVPLRYMWRTSLTQGRYEVISVAPSSQTRHPCSNITSSCSLMAMHVASSLLSGVRNYYERAVPMLCRAVAGLGLRVRRLPTG